MFGNIGFGEIVIILLLVGLIIKVIFFNKKTEKSDAKLEVSSEVISDLKIKKKKLVYSYSIFLFCIWFLIVSNNNFPNIFLNIILIIGGIGSFISSISFSYQVQKILQFSFGSKNSAKLYLVNSIIIAPAVIVIPAIVILEAKSTIKKNQF
jgi:hypothetical protein